MTGRRFDTNAGLLKTHLPWAVLKDDCGPHSLRHTTLDWLRTVTSPQVLATLAGHVESGATRHYLHPTFSEMCQAVERLFGSLDAPQSAGNFDPIDLPAVADRLARHGRALQ